MKDQPQITAFFDLDRTLILANSGRLYLQHEREQERITFPQLAISAWYLLLYHFSLVDLEKAFKKAALHYKGKNAKEVEEQTRIWFHEEIKERLLPGARQFLDAHQEQQHLCVLLTGSSEYMARLALETWNLDDWLANRFPIDEDGNFTGEVEPPVCYAEGKVVWAERWAESNQVDLSQCYFYTDSYSDLPMLKRVQHPRVVNPDPRLFRYAKQNNWPILDWRTTQSDLEPFFPPNK